jgi:hypothetical protein
MVLYLCVLIVFSLYRESLKLILATNPFFRWFCHMHGNSINHFSIIIPDHNVVKIKHNHKYHMNIVI